MFRIQPRRCHRRLEVEAEPLLNAQALKFRAAFGQVEEQDKVENNRRGQDGIPAQEIDLDLHRIAEPAEDIDVVPTLFVITARRVIVNRYLVVNIFV